MGKKLAALVAMLLLSVSPQPARAAAPALPPVVAQLDVLSTPTLGGGGQVLWAGFANEAPAEAELTFNVRPPAGVKEQAISMPLDLVKGELCERAYAFKTPQPGDYAITARLKLPGVDGKIKVIEAVKTVRVASEFGELRQKNAKEGVTAIPLTINGPLIVGAITQQEKYDLYSVDIPTTGNYVFECIPGTLYNHHLWLKKGYWQSGNAPCTYPHASSKLYRSLDPGRYTIEIYGAWGTQRGTYSIHVTKGLWANHVWANNDQGSTYKDVVTLNNTCTEGHPTQYMASESRNFAGAAWQPYSQAPIFTLSPGNGKKVIYFKVRDANGLVSPILDDEILRTSLHTLTLNGPLLTGSLQQLGQTEWFTFTVIEHGFYKIWSSQQSPPTLLYGPDSDTRLIANNVNNKNIIMKLVPGKYFVAIPSNGQFGAKYSIKLTRGIDVNRFFINADTAETTSRQVTLNNVCVGNPAKYQASIYWDFRDAGMQPYTPTVALKLPAGNGLKRVFFRVMDADGNRSDVFSDTISLRELVPLPVSSTWMPSYINWAGEVDWYRFTVPADGKYTLETQCGTLQDTMLDLLAANGVLIRRDDDSGVNYASKITVTLKRNTVYQAKVYAAFPGEFGTYSIHLKPAD